jgi:hypothetical protein
MPDLIWYRNEKKANVRTSSVLEERDLDQYETEMMDAGALASMSMRPAIVLMFFKNP